MYRIPVTNFIDKFGKHWTIVILDENTHEVIDTVRGGDNREYKLTNLDGLYVARAEVSHEIKLMVYVYRYPKSN